MAGVRCPVLSSYHGSNQYHKNPCYHTHNSNTNIRISPSTQKSIFSCLFRKKKKSVKLIQLQHLPGNNHLAFPVQRSLAEWSEKGSKRVQNQNIMFSQKKRNKVSQTKPSATTLCLVHHLSNIVPKKMCVHPVRRPMLLLYVPKM